MTNDDLHRFSETFWDDRYGSTDRVWSGRPNAALVDEVADLPPGNALDVGCGEGADAIWLAGRGWRVTGTDVSGVALRRAAAHAPPELAGRLRWERADLREQAPAVAAYDLVSAQFVLHFPAALHPLRDRIFARLAAAVAPGGQLLVAGHHFHDLDSGVHRPGDRTMFFTADDLAARLDPGGWTVRTAATRSRPWTDPDGRTVTLHDAVLRAQRHGAVAPG